MIYFVTYGGERQKALNIRPLTLVLLWLLVVCVTITYYVLNTVIKVSVVSCLVTQFLIFIC